MAADLLTRTIVCDMVGVAQLVEQLNLWPGRDAMCGIAWATPPDLWALVRPGA